MGRELHEGLRAAVCVGLLGWAAGCDEREPARAPGGSPGTGLPVGDGGTEAPRDEDGGTSRDCRDPTHAGDLDDDGYSVRRGDCDDCEALVNPSALDVPNNDVDEDCSGADAQGDAARCEADVDDESVDAVDAARVLGLCDFVDEDARAPGVLAVSLNGMDVESALESTLQLWMPETFGNIAPQQGERLLVLSTGVARDARARDYTEACDTLAATPVNGSWTPAYAPPPGFPKDSTLCDRDVMSSDVAAFNPVSLTLTLRAPSNARSLSFASMFFTYEYPDFLCSRFNDFFVVLADPAPAEADDANVLFDENGDPIGVNSGLLSVCRRSSRAARDVDCELGADLLDRTGFDRAESTCLSEVSNNPDIGGASTGWLETTVPVEPGATVTLRFLLWDSGDPLLDSTVLIDALRWSVDAPTLGTRPITSR